MPEIRQSRRCGRLASSGIQCLHFNSNAVLSRIYESSKCLARSLAAVDLLGPQPPVTEHGLVLSSSKRCVPAAIDLAYAGNDIPMSQQACVSVTKRDLVAC